MCQSSAPAQSTQSVSGLPAWAEPYAKDTLAKGAALTDTSKNPYPVYGGNRIAGFQPLQQQAFNTVSGLNAGPQGFAQGIGDYMSPYMQNVVDIEKREAGRQSGIAGTQQQAQATQAGAFGGGRDAIMRAERERNLGQQMGDIQAKGSQAAYEQAANQFRQGITQQSGLATQEAQLGQQQQQQAQRPLDVAYQDFQNQQNYPYKQLGYMADLIHGLPLGQKSTQAVYEGAPSPIQTVGALGMGAYGASKLFGANGGLMDSYAGGGMVAFGDGGDTGGSPMDDPIEMAKAVAKLSDQQLQEIVQHPSSAAELQAAKLELATRASEKNGLASAFNSMQQQQAPQQMAQQAPQQMPPQMAQQAPQQPMMQAAKGGIMGFAGDDGSDVDSEEGQDSDQVYGLGTNQIGGYSPGSQENFDLWNKDLRAAFKAETDYKPSSAMTEDERRKATAANYKEVQAMVGPDPSEGQLKRVDELEKQQAGNLEQQKGLAAFASIPAILKGTNAVRGVGAGVGAWGEMYGKAVQADREEKRSLMSMKNNLEQAQYKTKVGMVGDARQLTAEARRDKQAADAANIAKNRALGVLAAHGAALNKPQRPLAQKTPTSPKVNEQLADAEINFANSPSEANRKRVEALRSTVAQIKTSDVGPTKAGATVSQLGSKETLAAAAAAKKAALRNEDWQNATTQAEKDEVEQRLFEAELEKIQTGKKKLNTEKPAAPAEKPAPAPTAKPAPAAAVQPLPPNAKAADLKDGVVYSTPKGNGKWNAKTQKFTPVAAQ